MKWNKKYNYPKSSRSILNGSRHYNVDNQILPSVTSILGLTRSDSEKASLAAWANRVGKSESLRIKNSAAARGTEMHKKIEDFLLSRDNLNLFEEDSDYEKNKAKKMADLIIDEGLKPSLNEINGVECVCYYPGSKGYSGTSDLIGVFEGVQSVIDFKQKNSILKESYDSFSNYATQLGAYSLAHNTVYGSNITQGVILLATTDLVFQIFRVKGEKLIEYQNKFLERVEKYYSIVR
jgi:genome maintenance exonuclease 1